MLFRSLPLPSRISAEVKVRRSSRSAPLASSISNYDRLFKTYAGRIGWDWRLLAAQGWAESRFRPTARSWVGARGLMQIMPRTARGYRTPVSALNNPETSIRVATQLIDEV